MMLSAANCEKIVREYIEGTHGSLPNCDYEALSLLLSPNMVLTNESEKHDKDELLNAVFPGWSSIVEGKSSVRIHTVAANRGDVDVDDTKTEIDVLAHWETDYDTKDGSIWYGTDVDISGKQVRGFQVFASFKVTLGSDSQLLITRINQRSDTVVKKMGIEDEVRESRRRLGEKQAKQS